MPFHGGFGLLNIHGIAKPVYRAFELLHVLGTELLPVDGAHPTVDVWAIRDPQSVTVLVTNFALPRHPIATETIQLKLVNARPPAAATIRRIDWDHANAKRRWQEMGSPEYLSAANVEELNKASLCPPEPYPCNFQDGELDIQVSAQPFSVSAVKFQFKGTGGG